MSRRTFLAFLLGGLALVAPAHAGQTVLYERASAYNTIIVTEDDKGIRTLYFEKDGARQSAALPGNPDLLVLPYARVALVGLALSEESGRFLVVGLGGGTLPMFLRRHYPDAAIDAVDIDPEVVFVAKKFFGFREDEFMRAHVADGRKFIEQSPLPYDAIFLDAYGAGNIPAHLTTEEFLHAVRRAVAPGGVVVGNVWGHGSNPPYEAMVRTYRKVFDELLVLDVRGAGNRILLALPRRRSAGSEELTRLARNVSAARRFPFDLGDPALYRVLDARADGAAGRTLSDRDLRKRAPELLSR
jgi:spermidine synthase